jgi:hypothetical protein
MLAHTVGHLRDAVVGAVVVGGVEAIRLDTSDAQLLDQQAHGAPGVEDAARPKVGHDVFGDVVEEVEPVLGPPVRTSAGVSDEVGAGPGRFDGRRVAEPVFGLARGGFPPGGGTGIRHGGRAYP